MRSVTGSSLGGGERCLQDRAERWPPQFGGLARDQKAIMAHILHQALDQLDRRHAYAGRQRLAGLQALLGLDVALFDNPPPLGDFTLYVLAKLGRRHRHGRGAFAFKRRQQFWRF